MATFTRTATRLTNSPTPYRAGAKKEKKDMLLTDKEKIQLLQEALERLLGDIKFDGAASDSNINKAEKILMLTRIIK